MTGFEADSSSKLDTFTSVDENMVQQKDDKAKTSGRFLRN